MRQKIRRLVKRYSQDLTGGDSLYNAIIKGAGGFFVTNALGALLGFLLNIILARFLGQHNYGIYIYVFTWVNIMAIVSKLGFDKSLVRFIPFYITKNEFGLLHGILRKSILWISLVSLLFSLIGGLIVWFLDLDDKMMENSFYVGFMLLPFLALLVIPKAALRAFKKVVWGVVPDLILRRALLIVGIVVAYWILNTRISSSLALFLHLGAVFISLVVGIGVLFRNIDLETFKYKPISNNKLWIKTSLPLLALSGLFLIFNQTDLLMVGGLLPESKTGIYGGVSRIARLTSFGLLAVNAIMGPFIAELYHTQQFGKLQRVVTFSTLLIFAYTVCVSIVIILAGGAILSLFGSNFSKGYYPLLILTAGRVFNAFSGSVMLLLTMTKYHNQAAIIILASFILNLALNILFIPIFGLNGAALATAISTVSWNIAAIIFVKRKLGVSSTVFKFI